MSGYLAGTVYGVSLNVSALPTGSGLIVGQKAILPNGKEVTLVQNNPSGATIAKNAALNLLNASFQCNATPATANTIVIQGCNDNANSTIVVGNFFFMTERGLFVPLVAASVATQTMVNSSATIGTLAAASASTANQTTNIMSLAASGAGGATNCYKS